MKNNPSPVAMEDQKIEGVIISSRIFFIQLEINRESGTGRSSGIPK